MKFSPSRRILAAAALWAATVAACLLAPPPEPGGSSGIVMRFPTQLQGRTGETTEPNDGERRLLPEDTEFAKCYYYPASGGDLWDAALCSIIRTGSDRRSIHRPEICMQGQGWSINGSKTVSIPVGDGKSLDVTDLSLSRIEELEDGSSFTLRANYVYWFVGKDLTTPSNSERLLLTVSDNLFRNVNHRWAYASVMAYTTDVATSEVATSDTAASGQDVSAQGRSQKETAEFIYGIIRDLYPHLHPSL